MSPELQQNTIDVLLFAKEKVSVKDALNTLKRIDAIMQPRKRERLSPLTLKYQVRLHVTDRSWVA